MDLQQLYDFLIAEGCNRFYIDGIGGPQNDDVERLTVRGGKWQVCYTERGKDSEPTFSTRNKEEAITYYRDYILNLEHWHIITFTRSIDIFKKYKDKLESVGVRTIQNDIPAYVMKDDRIYRLFVVNKDIITAKELFEEVPFFDADLKR